MTAASSTWTLVTTLLALSGLVLFLIGETAPTDAQQPSPWESLAFCTERVNLSQAGVQADGESFSPSLSDDGRLVAFISRAGNLDRGDTNLNPDAFVHERTTGITRRISFSVHRTQDGTVGAGDTFISGNGRYVTFAARASYTAPGGSLVCGSPGAIRMQECVLVRDLTTSDLSIVDVRPDGSRGNSFSRWPALSFDGRLIAFWSHSRDLVPGDTNTECDVFARDRAAGTTERVSVASDGSQVNGASGDVAFVGADAVAVSRDGRLVVFPSRASNLVPGDTNGRIDVFLRNRASGTTERVSVASNGSQGDRDSVLGVRQAVSDDGRFVAFSSLASNLVPGDTNSRMDIFIRDRAAGTTERVSVASGGSQGNRDSGPLAAISADGRFVAFNSAATNLVPGDTNGRHDIFVRDRAAGRTVRVSVSTSGQQANGDNGSALWRGLSITPDGLTVAWSSTASNLVTGDTNGTRDIFVRFPCPDQPTPSPTASPSSTATPTSAATPTATVEPTATRTSSPTPTAAPTQLAYCVCDVVRKRAPPVVIADALANPERYYGWRYPPDQGKTPRPNTPPLRVRSCRQPRCPTHVPARS